MPKLSRTPSSSSQNLTNGQKQHLAAHYNAQIAINPSYTHSNLADWAKDAYNLSYTPSRSTISRLLNQNPAQSSSPSSSRKKLSPTTEELDRLLAEWVDDQQKNGLMVNTHLIKLQGQRYQDMLNRRLPPHQQLPLRFSNDWLDKFCQRHSFRQQVAHGESASVQQGIINQELPTLRNLLQQFSPDDIFNADETGLFYNMPPNKTIAASPTSGLKKKKTRISILFACNSSGTEKLDLLFIGHSQQPKAFQKQSPEQLGIHYFSNKKAWMTSSIFTTWLISLDLYIGRTPGRHILLLLDNFSGHGTLQKPLADLQNITIHFLPPNTTSKIQPLDAGMIACFKKHYRSKQYARALLEAELGSQDIYHMDILEAMKVSQQIWKDISTNTIRNCWRHTGLVDLDAGDQSEDAKVDKELEETLKRLTEVSVQDVVEPAGEEAEESDTATPPGSPLGHGKELNTALLTAEEQLDILQAAQDILTRQNLMTSSTLEAFSACISRLSN
ncbi:related to transposases [Sporisorium reilianum SRZ2]|uniref:Related to transposases n=1 Tax=Sporisorium reilianum (strain SRZ2) TaxID=999809 RepID=E6ZRJ4_SPORE|nr:related to transposases [Sporisorium reilianum SRZ2]